jgi:hypothetical protein
MHLIGRILDANTMALGTRSYEATKVSSSAWAMRYSSLRRGACSKRLMVG